MLINEKNLNIKNTENKFVDLYKMVQERESFLNNDAKILQYGVVLEYFYKFLDKGGRLSDNVLAVLFWCYIKIGDVFYDEGVYKQDNNKFFMAVDYYNQALKYAKSNEEKNRILLMLREVYSYLNDKDAMLKIEENWVENQDTRDRFSAYMSLASSTDNLKDKAMLLEKALNEVTKQEMSFYNKYQDTLNVCSQLIALYELLNEESKLQRIKTLQKNTLNLLN